MRFGKNVLLLGLFALLLTLSGCCCGGGTDTKTVETKIVEQPVSNVALGEELIKLQEARDKGAINEKEYEEAKAKLLKGQ